jgi:hypothetical protein
MRLTNMKEETWETNDILLGRGPSRYRNPGNVAFRHMILVEIKKYSLHASRSVKNNVIQSLIAKAKDQGRRFLVWSQKDDAWCEAHPRLIRSKISHALRDARQSAKDYDSSMAAKLSKHPSLVQECKRQKNAISFVDYSMNSYRFNNFPVNAQRQTIVYVKDYNAVHNYWENIDFKSSSALFCPSKTESRSSSTNSISHDELIMYATSLLDLSTFHQCQNTGNTAIGMA